MDMPYVITCGRNRTTCAFTLRAHRRQKSHFAQKERAIASRVAERDVASPAVGANMTVVFQERCGPLATTTATNSRY